MGSEVATNDRGRNQPSCLSYLRRLLSQLPAEPLNTSRYWSNWCPHSYWFTATPADVWPSDHQTTEEASSAFPSLIFTAADGRTDGRRSHLLFPPFHISFLSLWTEDKSLFYNRWLLRLPSYRCFLRGSRCISAIETLTAALKLRLCVSKCAFQAGLCRWSCIFREDTRVAE